jgi:hypothetical protein
MLKKIVLLSILSIGFAFSNMASASLIYASSVQSSTVGTAQGTSNGRDNINSLFGAVDGTFYELGRGGNVVLLFGNPTGQLFSKHGFITEVTFGNASDHPESVDIFVGLNGVFTFAQSILNTGSQAGIQFFFDGPFDSMKIVDTTTFTGSGGFDIDSVAVKSVPEPAGILLLGAGLALIGLRKRFT